VLGPELLNSGWLGPAWLGRLGRSSPPAQSRRHPWGLAGDPVIRPESSGRCRNDGYDCCGLAGIQYVQTLRTCRQSMVFGATDPGERTQSPSYGERTIAEAELICFDNPRPGRAYEVSIELPEFTCKCPFSGYPDFAVLRLLYQPGPRVLELKALKLYVNGYRERTISHEEVANLILDDFVTACEPLWMELVADFNPRGNVHTLVRVSHGQRQPC